MVSRRRQKSTKSKSWRYCCDSRKCKTFLKENNLAGKKIIPFATNAGWIGRTFREIKEICSNSNVENEMNVVFTEDYKSNELVTSNKEIENWINKL